MQPTAESIVSGLWPLLSFAAGLDIAPQFGRVLNSKKVSDHHAIIPTMEFVQKGFDGLAEGEKKLLSLVCCKLLCAVAAPHVYEAVTATFTCAGNEFTAKGKTILTPGWKEIERRFKASFKTDADEDAPELARELPEITEGQTFDPVEASITEHFTTPPKPYTEDTLLSAMERAGAEDMPEDAERQGLGTPATRASILEKLVQMGFVERKGKQLLPTKDGHNLVCVLPEVLTSPQLTAEWETKLTAIAKGEADPEGFMVGIQTSENGFDYTVYGPDYKEIDGGQLDNTEYSLSEARDEILSGIAPQGHVTETITGDALEDFQEAAEQANAISVQPEPQPWNGIDGLLNNKPIMPEATPTERANALIDWAERDGQRMGNEERRLIVEYAETVGDTDKVIELINRLCEQGYEMQHGHMDDFVRSQIESEIAVAKAEQQTALDPAAEPVVTILFTESPHLEMGQQMPLHEADALFARLDAEHRGGGYYDKTDFRIDFTFQGEPHSYSGRQDFGDRDGSLIEHIREYQTFYLNDEKWKDHLTRQGGPEAWAEDHASREAFLTEIIPYMELHCNLSRLEQEAQTRLASSDTLTPEETAYYGALVDYAMECRPLLNHGEPLPEMPKLTDFDQSLQDYKAQVEAEIAQEAADAGMTVEEYAAAGYEALAQPQEAQEPPQQETPAQPTKEPAVSDYYYSINEGAARRAKEMNSFSDYQPGSATAEYRHYVDEAFALAQEQKKRVDPMYHEKIDSLLDTYARKLAANMNHGYEIDARVPSILIAGGSNFPVRQKEKQNAARDSNMQEWQYIQGLLDKIRSTGMGGIRQDDPQAIPKLQKKLAGLEKAQETMKAVNAYYRKHGTLDGCPHLAPENIENLKADMASGWHHEKKPFQSWELSNNNAEIRRVRQRIESLTRANEVAYVGWEFDGGHVEANRDQGRLQVFFDGKPEADARQQLKENGFRWAPSVGAWQRLLNDNAYRASDRIACIQPLSGIKPTELQRNSSREQRAQMAQEQAEPDYFYRVHANPRSDSRENLYMLQAYIPQDNGRAKIGDTNCRYSTICSFWATSYYRK